MGMGTVYCVEFETISVFVVVVLTALNHNEPFLSDFKI